MYLYTCVCVCVCVCVRVSKLKIVAARRQEYLRRPSQSCTICVWHTSVLPNRPGSSSTSFPFLPLSSPISRSRPRDCWRRCAVAIGVHFHFLQSIARNGHEGCHVHLLSVSHDPSVPPSPHTHAYSCSLQMANCIAHVYACCAPPEPIHCNFARVALHYIWFTICLHIIVDTHTLYTQYSTTYRYTQIHGYTYVCTCR